MDNEELLEEVRNRLVSALRPSRIVVFGSRARGEARPDSDLDLMVVAAVRGSLGDRALAARTPLLDLRVPMDIVVYTPEEYARLRHWKSSVAGIADREGRVLYGWGNGAETGAWLAKAEHDARGGEIPYRGLPAWETSPDRELEVELPRSPGKADELQDVEVLLHLREREAGQACEPRGPRHWCRKAVPEDVP